MKAKKKLLSIILAAIMLVPCMTALAACDGGTAGHTHTWEEKYSYDSSGHWKKCTQCSKTTEKENHNYEVDTCKVCGYVDKSKTPPQKEAMSKYFSGVKATYEKEKFIDSDGTEKEFKDLVDRQIDVLAQDILIRLNYVYGDLRADPANEWVWGSSFELRRLDGLDAYKYDDKVTGFHRVAKVYTENMLAEISDEEYDSIDNGTFSLAEVDIDNLVDYQKSLLIKDTEKNIFANTIFFNQIGANSGQNMKVVTSGRYDILKLDDSKKWIVSDLTTNDAHNALKLAIVQELTNEPDNPEYDSLIDWVDKLGYDSAFAEKLENIINNKIIGVDRINEDNTYYNIIKNQYGGKINADTVKAMNDKNAGYSETNSPRLYKGYKVIVKQIVKSALENKFSSTKVSLYPAFDKKAVDYTTNAAGFAEARRYETMTLIPRVGTGYTKLAVKIKGVDVSGDAALSLELKINNTIVSGKHIDLTNEEQIIEISFFNYGVRDPFEAYQGNKTADTNNNIFVNSVVEDFDEKNFIKLTFTNRSNAKFIVTFDGYYDRKA